MIKLSRIESNPSFLHVFGDEHNNARKRSRDIIGDTGTFSENKGGIQPTLFHWGTAGLFKTSYSAFLLSSGLKGSFSHAW